jgi:hypothetical protein
MKGLSDHGQSNIIRFLIAHKLDLTGQRMIDTEAGKQKAKQYDAAYREVSAVTASGIADR